MADYVSVHSVSTLVHTGKGQFTGIVLTAKSGTPLCTIYNNTTNAGTKIFEAYAPVNHPLVILFDDRFAPRFTTGCYIELTGSADPSIVTATFWTRRL